MRLRRFIFNESHAERLKRATVGVVDSKTQKNLFLEADAASRVIFLFILTMLLFIGIGVAVTGLLNEYGLYNRTVLNIAGPLIGASVGASFWKLKEKKINRKYSLILRREDVRPNFCLICKYDLKGSTAQLCPECGEPLAPPIEEQP